MEGLSRVTPHIHRLVVPFLDIYTTVFFVETPEGAVLFDTATYPEDIDRFVLPAMKELGIEKLAWVVISHNHRDHGGGLERIARLLPDTGIAAGSKDCGQRVPGRQIRVLKDGETLLGPLEAVAMPGHTADCVGILDRRTNTLLSGDGLQLWGIYGSGNWGANISLIPEHLALGKRLLEMAPETILAAHDYHPMGWMAQGEQVEEYIRWCTRALEHIWEYARQYPDMEPEALADQFNGQSGLPKVGAHIFRAVRAAFQA